VNPIKIGALVLIVAGVLGLVYGSFSYTKETHEAKVGPIELTMKNKETVNIPVWAEELDVSRDLPGTPCRVARSAGGPAVRGPTA
jgi:hypothetical protein